MDNYREDTYGERIAGGMTASGIGYSVGRALNWQNSAFFWSGRE